MPPFLLAELERSSKNRSVPFLAFLLCGGLDSPRLAALRTTRLEEGVEIVIASRTAGMKVVSSLAFDQPVEEHSAGCAGTHRDDNRDDRNQLIAHSFECRDGQAPAPQSEKHHDRRNENRPPRKTGLRLGTDRVHWRLEVQGRHGPR